MINPRVKTTGSTSTVTFRNTSGSYYDMILLVLNNSVNQSITITDTEGNLITENPIVVTVPAKVILKDIQVGQITFSDSNSYNVVISYVVKETASGIPYVDIDYETGYTYVQTVGTPKVYFEATNSGNSGYDISPPSGKKWLIHSIVMYWEAAATQTDIAGVQIEATSTGSELATPWYNYALFAYYQSISVTASDKYIVSLGEYLQSMSDTSISSYNVYQDTVHGKLELLDNESLFLGVTNETNPLSVVVAYTEVNLG